MSTLELGRPSGRPPSVGKTAVGMLDGEYWVVNAVECLGVTTERDRAEEALKKAFLEEHGLPEDDRKYLDVRLKFDQLRLTRLGLDVAGFYATNEKKL